MDRKLANFLSHFVLSVMLGLLSSCNSQMQVAASKISYPDLFNPDVQIEVATDETIGACTFNKVTDPYNAPGFSYKIEFSEEIDPTTFDASDIINIGTGVATWSLLNCGDNKNYELTADTATNGTIIPEIASAKVKDLAGNDSDASASVDNSITIDTIIPTVTVEQSILQTVGSCSFTAVTEPASVAGFSYRVTFSKAINLSTFTLADINNSGTGGSLSLEWKLDNCGDNRNFKLSANNIYGNGTIIPSIGAARVQDIAGNSNTASTSTDNSIDFQKSGWVQEAYIKAANVASPSYFGNSVVIDGDTAVIGAAFESSNQTTITNGTTASTNTSMSASGAVYVYKRTGSNWVQEAYIKAASLSFIDYFGGISGQPKGIALHKDTLAVGMLNEDSTQTTITNGGAVPTDNSRTDSGAVYVFKRTGATWAFEAFIKASNAVSKDNFGYTLALHGDTLAVSSKNDSSQNVITNGAAVASTDVSYVDSGAVYIYKRTGSTWAQEAFIKSSNSDYGDLFGSTVALSGNTLIVGASGEDGLTNTTTSGGLADNGNEVTDSGAVYVFNRADSLWSQTAYIKAPNAKANDKFGASVVAISGDLIALGHSFDTSNQNTITNGTAASMDTSLLKAGSVFIYKRNGDLWEREAYIKASNNAASQLFGADLSLSGNTLVVSSAGDGSNQTTITNDMSSSLNTSAALSGAAFVYQRGSAGWFQEAYLKAPNAEASDKFGSSVAISGDTIVVGATNEKSSQSTITNGPTASADNTVTNAGAAYVFRNTKRLFDPSSFTTFNVSSNSIQLSWSSSGIKASGVKIAYSIGTTAPSDCRSGTVVDAANTTSYFVPGLLAGTNYSFRICSYDSSGNLSLGYTSTFQTALYTPDVTSLASVPNSVSDVTINWVSGGGLTTGYKLAWQAGATAPVNCNSGTVVDVGTATTYQITGLSAVPVLSVRVCSYDSSSHLSAGRYITVETKAAPEPIDPYSISASETTTTINWTSGGGATTGYRLAWAIGRIPPGTCFRGTNLDLGNATSYTITGLTSQQQVSVRICSYISSGVGLSKGVTVLGASLNTGWNQEAFIKASNSDAGDFFGDSVDIHGDTLAVKAPQEDSNQSTITNGPTSSSDNSATGAGAFYIYKRTGKNWIQEAYIKRPNADASDFFYGDISIQRDTLAIGAPLESSNLSTITNGTTTSSDNSKSEAGAVYVYRRTGSNWAQEAFIKASNSDATDRFGLHVSVYGDTLVASSTYEASNQTTITNGATAASTNNSKTYSGAAYVYKRTGALWAQEAYIKAVNADANDMFGYSVSIYQDTLVVGAYAEGSNQTTITNGATASSNNSLSSSGALYVYKRTGSTWAQEAYIKAANAANTSLLGNTVSLSGDRIAAAAIYEGSAQTTITNGSTAPATSSSDVGAVYIYVRNGVTWTQEAFIKATNHPRYFGSYLKFAGNTLVVGIESDNSTVSTITNSSVVPTSTDTFANTGGVYVFSRSTGLWIQEAFIKALNPSYQDNFGKAVSVSGDTIVVGAVNESSKGTRITNGNSVLIDDYALNSGAVYVYRNVTRLFEVADISATAASSSITLNWMASGGSATGYTVAFQSGTTPPATCALGTVVDVGNVLTVVEAGLTASTNYSFRVCSHDGSNTSTGMTLTIATTP
jgi:hypothetical protein